MQWVETTGRTIEDAKEAALDQLGIDETEAEFEIVEEPKTGLFGRVRSEARVRARVLPRSPRPKQERRPRRQKGKRDGNGGKGAAGATAPEAPATAKEAPATDGGTTARQGDGERASSSSGNRRRGGGRRSGSKAAPAVDNQEGNEMSDETVSVDEQADIISEFLEGLVEALGVEGQVSRTKVDDDTIELSVTGSELGLLIGPKGQTITAVHELARTVLQRRATGRHEGRVRIDIGGYRQRRQEALARFVRQQAEEVLAQGVSRALEPMNAVDRKVVHDTINEIEGVSTLSEGVDPNRRVVIVAEGADDGEAGEG